MIDPSDLDRNRRSFLKLLAAGGGALLLPRSLRAAVPLDPKSPDAPRLLVVFQRGACDGASILVPWSSDDYHRLRPNTAIARPDPADPKASDLLDDSWSLHPALRESMLPLWRRKELAFVPFAGTDDLSRSHFETQERIEEGIGPDIELGGANGWLSRLVGLLDPTSGISFTADLPTICSGGADIPNLPLHEVPKDPFDPRQSDLLASLYKGDPLEGVVKSGLKTRDDIAKMFVDEMQAASGRAISSAGFEQEARRMGSLLRKRYRVGFVDVGGWDTHVNQGAAQGQLANLLGNLGRGLSALRAELDDAWPRTLVVVLTEFGRTFRENGNRGTDHGHGSVMWFLGGSIQGGRIHGRQQRVAEGTLFQNRDFPILNEYRSVLGSVLGRHFRMDRAAVEKVFPGSSQDGSVEI
ncbi:MAG TPA: DUF1501 domain-containing protein [Fibrobacteria bacterium]|nr:DUF1501 domain-containing protein [Fibrobacteria bacterium]